jgi:hypothetical protein
MSNAKIETNKPEENATRELSLVELETVSATKGASSGKTNSGATFLQYDFKQVSVTSF